MAQCEWVCFLYLWSIWEYSANISVILVKNTQVCYKSSTFSSMQQKDLWKQMDKDHFVKLSWQDCVYRKEIWYCAGGKVRWEVGVEGKGCRVYGEEKVGINVTRWGTHKVKETLKERWTEVNQGGFCAPEDTRLSFVFQLILGEDPQTTPSTLVCFTYKWQLACSYACQKVYNANQHTLQYVALWYTSLMLCHNSLNWVFVC